MAHRSLADQARKNAVARCRERNILIPSLFLQKNPQLVEPIIQKALEKIDPQAMDPLNLFRITWKNDPKTGGFGNVNTIKIPSELSGVRAQIIGMVGKHFPTGAHKVGAAFGCLVPRLVRGGFDPTTQKAVWPSTGNYCRGGVFDSNLLGCKSVAILPEEMSRERFLWLEKAGAEIIATPGCESNVKEIFDACKFIRTQQPEVVVFNQFEEFGNYLWHYEVTGNSAEEAHLDLGLENDRLTAWIGASGSAGTLGAGDYLKKRFPGCMIVAAEALQCPTLTQAGFGAHRIEGIGDKHIPWIHNTRNTDVVTAIDDEATLSLLRLFNEKTGHDVLISSGIPEQTVRDLHMLGISSICNLLAAIKTAQYFELTENDVLFTCFTDSAEMYQTRLDEMRRQFGPFTTTDAHVALQRRLYGVTTDNIKELRYPEKKAIHNLKYYTWVEQQGKSLEDLNALWSKSFWHDLTTQLPSWDDQIEQFNSDTNVFQQLSSQLSEKIGPIEP